MSRQTGNWSRNQVFRGYPNFMHTAPNPMQSGFNWSSFVSPNSNKSLVENENKNYEKNFLQMQNLMGPEYSLMQRAGYYNFPMASQTYAQVSGIKNEISSNFVEIPSTSEQDNLNGDPGNIHQKRNPVSYCTSYCAHRRFVMEFVQVGEYGPPHDKTFIFCLKIVTNPDGVVLQTAGVDKTKLGSKRYAAEAMIFKLHAIYGPLPAQVGKKETDAQGKRPPLPKEKRPAATEVDDTEWLKSRALKTENNPISNLYDWARRKKVSEPTFDMIKQEVVDTKEIRNPRGRMITLERSRYTIRCTFMEKDFEATEPNKKKAKFMAATAAWKEVVSKQKQNS